jgi:hypothetical protein
MSEPVIAERESYSPWSIVHLVFQHLAGEGLHPVLGETGDPSGPAAALLAALGIEASAAPSQRATSDMRAQLAELRAALLDERDEEG